MTCKWDREAEDYLNDGEPCRTDDYGDPTRHCTARRTCSVHIGADELTCPRCIGRTRAHLHRIVQLAALAEPIAVTSGINSPAAYVSGPSAHPLLWSWRKVNARMAAATAHLSGETWDEAAFARAVDRIEEDDDRHPGVVIRWAAMISEDYGHDMPERWTLSNAADYLDRNLARIANDPEQDWRLLSGDLRKCRRFLETVDATSVRRERGVPCPDCCAEGVGGPKPPRLVREYGHWCDDEGCEQVHYDTDEGDLWVCQRDRTHWRTVAEYDAYLAERRGA